MHVLICQPLQPVDNSISLRGIHHGSAPFHCRRGPQEEARVGAAAAVGGGGVGVPTCATALSSNPDGGRRARAQKTESTTALRAHQELLLFLFVGGYNKSEYRSSDGRKEKQQ